MAIVRYYASARAAAGVSEEQVDASTSEALRKELVERHGARFAAILAVSSVLRDGRAVTDADDLATTDVIEVLPPFAGG